MGSVSQLAAESFVQLVMPHFDRLYNFGCWLTHDRQEGEDLVQVLTSRTGLKARATVPLDLEREEEALPAARETPESILLQRSDEQFVRRPLEPLPVAYRQNLLLCEVERDVLPGNL